MAPFQIAISSIYFVVVIAVAVVWNKRLELQTSLSPLYMRFQAMMTMDGCQKCIKMSTFSNQDILV